MARNSCTAKCLVLVAIISLPAGLMAQDGPSLKRSQRPVTSPYLNLLNRGNNNFSDPGLNYYRNVRPEQEWRQSLQKQDKELQSLAQGLKKSQSNMVDSASAKSIRRTLNSTGHSTSFQNSGGYFRRR